MEIWAIGSARPLSLMAMEAISTWNSALKWMPTPMDKAIRTIIPIIPSLLPTNLLVHRKWCPKRNARIDECGPNVTVRIWSISHVSWRPRSCGTNSMTMKPKWSSRKPEGETKTFNLLKGGVFKYIPTRTEGHYECNFCGFCFCNHLVGNQISSHHS